MAFFLFVVILIYLFILHSKINKVERSLSSQPQKQSSTAQTSTEWKPAVQPQMSKVRTDKGPDTSGKFIEWIEKDWLVKLGALLILIGLGWFVSYAFANGWIGPVGRIALGLAAGFLIMLLGVYRAKMSKHQAGIFLVLGSGGILTTIWAAREIYDFFTPFSALIIMFLTVAFVALMSVRYRSEVLGIASLILAVIAPLLTAVTLDFTSLFSYLLIVMAGTLWIVVITGWRTIPLIGIAIMILYSISYWTGFENLKSENTALLMSFAFTLLFFVVNTFAIIKGGERKSIREQLTAAATGIFLLLWIITAAPEQWESLMMIGWMLVFALGAFWAFTRTKNIAPFITYGMVSVVLLGAATAAETNGSTLTIAYTLEAGLLVGVVYWFLRNISSATKASLFFIVPILMSIDSISSLAWYDGIFHQDFVVILLLALVLFFTGLALRAMRKETDSDDGDFLVNSLLVLGVAYAFTLIWLAAHASSLSPDAATGVALTIYTLAGLITHFYGKFNEKKPLVVFGGIVLAGVVLRLLVIDVWQLDVTGRIVMFLLIGALLAGTAFIGRKDN